MEQKELDNLRHSAAHLLAAAVDSLWPKAKRTIGPSIENGFYFDFDFGDIKISEEDFPKIEKKMHEILKSWEGFEGREVSVEDAKKLYKDNEYKLELIEEFSGEGQKLTIYKSGEYEDLCRGGHIENPSEKLNNFKLLSIAGAYWRGSEKNKMLSRIYGTVFPTKEELDNYLTLQAEAEMRDHKKIGRELDLFMFHETAPGMAYWLPKGVFLYNALLDFWREEHRVNGYQEIFSPLMNKKELYEISGHWDHYRDDMFIVHGGTSKTSWDKDKLKYKDEFDDTYALKPMNCPNAMIIFGSKTRSYRDLPLRLSDTDCLHRYERPGVLNGLLRIREFRQDDAHLFVTEEQIKPEFKKLFELTERFYSIFGLEYRYRLGTMPEKHIGEVGMWDKAVGDLKEILKESKKEYFVLEGDGAFYGPKIDILMKDSLGREWQMGTLQLDFQLPGRFNLKYAAEDGTQKAPVVLHRVIYGSLERFIGLITEHFAGSFPTWISPVQVKVIPISEKNLNYAETVAKELDSQKIRVETDHRNEPLGAKVRDAQLQKVPYLLVVGDKEAEGNTVSVRKRGSKDSVVQSVEEFTKSIKNQIEEKIID